MEWIYFNFFIGVMLVFDLAIFHRKEREIGYREALTWTVVWISLALSFNVILYFTRGPEAALNFFTGYLIEKSLSIDNLFVFLLIFNYFAVPKQHLHRVLFYGVVGAMITRVIFIFAGVELIERFPLIIYLFGLFLMYSGVKFLINKNQEAKIESNFILKLLYRWIPVTNEYHGNKFFLKQSGKIFATPLFIVLLVVEGSDVIFAMDSVPAILAITTDPFIVYTSNVFAILGLRTLYFVLTRFMDNLYYLHEGIAALLIFIGIKMLLSHYIDISAMLSLLVIFLVISISVIASVVYKKCQKKK